MSDITDFINGSDDGPNAATHSYASLTGNSHDFPLLSTTDTLRMPTSGTSSFARNPKSGATIWTVTHTNINAAADGWCPAEFLDTIDNALWVFALDSGTSPPTTYVAKIALANGAITNVGSFQSTRIGQVGCVRRATMGSGNLLLYVNSTGNGAIYKLEISTTDGSLVSETAINASIGATHYYMASDESFVVTAVQTNSEALGHGYMGCYRTSDMFLVQIPLQHHQVGLAYLSTGGFCVPTAWNGHIVMGNGRSAGRVIVGKRLIDQASFETWVKLQMRKIGGVTV
jgi:hypothetical protein